MPLPILNIRQQPSPADLLRLFDQTETRWVQHVAGELLLDVGVAFSNPILDQVHYANNIRDVALPDGLGPAQAVAQVEEHYRRAGTRCAFWTFNPSARPHQTAPLIEHLSSLGYRANQDDVMLLGHNTLPPLPPDRGVKIIPARASFKHVRGLFEEWVRERDWPLQLVDAALAHLDDPHWDALLALKDGRAVAYLGVLAAGELGRIEEVLVARDYRGQGLGRLMMLRALEICARSLFKHVMLQVDPANEPARRLYKSLGFERIGQVTTYLAPWTKSE